MDFTWWYVLGCALWLVHALFLSALCYIVYYDAPQMRMFYQTPLYYARCVVALLGAALCMYINPRLGVLWVTLLCLIAYAFRAYAHEPASVCLYPHEWRWMPSLTPALVALLCALCLLDVTVASDWSGYPAIAKGDYALLARWPYGVYFWPTNTWLWRYADARLGDRVYVQGHADWIGRVVGSARDTVAFTNDGLRVNNKLIAATLDESWRWPMPGVLQRECLHATCYRTWQWLDVQLPSRTELTLLDNQMYVVSDNRSFAVDSRVWGSVSARHVVAKVYTISEFMGLFSF